MTGCFFHDRVRVLANQPLVARAMYLIRLDAAALARAIRPGQFLTLRLANNTDPLLGRPFALYDTVLDPCHRCTTNMFLSVMNIVVWYSVQWRPKLLFDLPLLKRSLFPGL